MTKQDRIKKMLNEQELTLIKILLLFEDSNLILNNKDLYEDIEKSIKNNKFIQEELAY